jgi:hypothetical protein
MSSNSKRKRQKVLRKRITAQRRSGVTKTKIGPGASIPLPARTSTKQYRYVKRYPKAKAAQL